MAGPSRRSFLAGTVAGLTATVLARNVFGANDKLAHAGIGSGGMGGGDLNAIKGHPKAQIIALCDVDANTLNGAAKRFPDARRYADWREMLEKEPVLGRLRLPAQAHKAVDGAAPDRFVLVRGGEAEQVVNGPGRPRERRANGGESGQHHPSNSMGHGPPRLPPRCHLYTPYSTGEGERRQQPGALEYGPHPGAWTAPESSSLS